MQKITLPNGNTLTCADGLQAKIEAMQFVGIDYMPTAEEQAEETANQTDIIQLKAEYQATIAQLQNIEGATNPTNAQVIAAVKFLAKTLRLLLKLLARQYK